MSYIKGFSKFCESLRFEAGEQNLSDILESLSVFEDSLLNSIKAEEADILKAFNYARDIKGKLNIEDLSGDVKFIEALSKQNLRKSDIQNTDDYETFLKKPMKFMPIFDVKSNDLANPSYLLIQTYNDSLDAFNEVKLYKVNDDMKKFYDKLSSKTIEIVKDGKNYIYETSNSGNNWELKNLKDESETFKRFLYPEELKKILSNSSVKVSII